MEELFEQLKRAVAPAQDSAANRTATAMDGISDRMADAAAASYIASIAEDGDFKEEAHPREAKGGKGGGRFRTSGETIEKQDEILLRDPDAKDPHFFAKGDRVYVHTYHNKRGKYIPGGYGTVVKGHDKTTYGHTIYADVMLDRGELLKDVAEPDMRHTKKNEEKQESQE